MTTNNTNNRSGPYAGDGVSTVFNVTFYFLLNTELLVTRLNADGSSSVLALNTDYTVSGAGVGAGGSITLVTSGTPDPTKAPVGSTITITPNPSLVQNQSYPATGPFPSLATEQGFDRLTIVANYLLEKINRCLTQVVTSANAAPTISDFTGHDGAIPIYNNLTKNFDVGPTASGIAAAQGYAAAALQSQLLSAAAAGFTYTYLTAVTSTDPGAGKLNFNNASLASATIMYISETTSLAQAIAAEIATWDDSTSTIHGKLRIFKQADPSVYAIFNVTGTETDLGAWDSVTVAYVGGNGALANNDAVTVQYIRTGDKGDTGGAGPAGPSSSRNYLVNGAFNVAQRGASYALTGSFAYGSADRWGFKQVSPNGIANVVASGLTGFKNCLKMGVNSGTISNAPLMLQALESIDSIPLQGQTVTLSWWAKAGANFSAASNVMNATVRTGTGTDQSAATAASWTGAANTTTTKNITTSWAQYSFTTTIPSSATQAAVQFDYTPSGTAGADDNLYITGIKLEIGSSPTTYEQPPIEDELSRCQRWLYVYNASSGAQEIIATAQAYTTVNITAVIIMPVEMRAALAAISVSNATHFGCFSASGSNTALTALAFSTPGKKSIAVMGTVASGLVAGNASQFYCQNASAQLISSAEL